MSATSERPILRVFCIPRVNLSNGYVSYGYKPGSGYVWPVRGGN